MRLRRIDAMTKVLRTGEDMTPIHPEEESYEEQFNKLTSEVKEWRNKLAHGLATTEEFLAWLMEFSEDNSK